MCREAWGFKSLSGYQPMSSAYYNSEFQKTHGKPSTGDYKHFCPDWDGMPIDNTCPEFDACLCYREAKTASEPWLDEHFGRALGLLLVALIGILLVVLTR